MKRKILDMYNSLVLKLKVILIKSKRIIKKLIIELKIRYWEFKKWLLKSEYRQRNLGIILVLIIVNILILNIFYSNAYYHKDANADLIRSVVGNINGNTNDYTLLVYLEDVNSNSENRRYHLGETIPLIGYTYSGYTCQNNSTLIYDDETKTTTVSLEHKEVCSIFFNLNSGLDISITIMLENSYNSNTYTLSNTIPAYGYHYERYVCDNNSTLTYNSTLHYALLDTHNQDYCQIYFNKDNTNVVVNLFVEVNNEYQEMLSIPSNIEYTLDTINTGCFNNLDESGEGIVTYIDGYINVEGSNISYCNVYLRENNE